MAEFPNLDQQITAGAATIETTSRLKASRRIRRAPIPAELDRLPALKGTGTPTNEAQSIERQSLDLAPTHAGIIFDEVQRVANQDRGRFWLFFASYLSLMIGAPLAVALFVQQLTENGVIIAGSAAAAFLPTALSTWYFSTNFAKIETSEFGRRLLETSQQAANNETSFRELLDANPELHESIKELAEARQAELAVPKTNAELLAEALIDSSTRISNYYMFEVENNLVTMSPRDLDEVDLQPRPIEDQTIAQIITDTINSISDDWDPNSTTKFRFLANTGDIEIKNHLSHQVFPTDAVDQEKLVAKLCGYLYEPRGQDHFSTRFHNHKEAGQHNDIEHSPTPSQRPCLLYTSPSPRDRQKSRMPSSA